MTTYYLSTFVQASDLPEFEKTKDIRLIKQMPLTTDQAPDHIQVELQKQGLVLLGLETEEMLEHKLGLVRKFKQEVAEKIAQEAV